MHEITPSMTDAYAADVWADGFTANSYNQHIKFLRRVFRTLTIAAGLTENPWDHINSLEKETESRRALTTKELACIVRKAKGDVRYWIAIGLYTGMRRADVICLRWDSVDLKKGIIEYMPRKTDRKKKIVKVPMHPVLQGMLVKLKKTAKKNAEYLFPQAVKDYAKDPTKITDQINALFKLCKIKTTSGADKKHRKKAIVEVGFHSLRHSFVSLCANNNVPQVAIQELVGHGSPAMTALYSHADADVQAKAIAGLPDVGGKTKPKRKSATRKKAVKDK